MRTANKEEEWVLYFEKKMEYFEKNILKKKWNPETGGENLQRNWQKIILSFPSSVDWNGVGTNVECASPNVHHKSH